MGEEIRIKPKGAYYEKWKLCLEFEKVCESLKKCGYDLSKIKIVEK